MFGRLTATLGLAVCNVNRAHVTLWHKRNGVNPPLNLIGCNGHLIVDAVINANDCLQVALQVRSITVDGKAVLTTNNWPHITVACEKNEAFLTNMLPEKLLGGTATKREFPPVSLLFTVTGE